MKKLNKYRDRLERGSIRDEEDYTQSSKGRFAPYNHWSVKMRDEACSVVQFGKIIAGIAGVWAMHTKRYDNVSELEKQFNELSQRWKDETGLFSTTYQKIVNDLYFEIVALGDIVVPYILKDLQNNGTAHWHTALKALTKENPIPDESAVTNKQIREAWISWGKGKNLIK